jgi:formylglycine-generating enzyme required for sulfatase activity
MHRVVCGLLLCVSSLLEAGDKNALPIGVSKYDHAEMNKPEPLKFPEEDGKSLAELLRSGGYEFEVLLGNEATRQTIETKLAALAKKGSAEGILLIRLFGHGVEIETRDDRNKAVMERCFCPFDTHLRIVKDGKDRPLSNGNGQPLIEPDPASLVRLSDLMLTLKVAKAGNRVVLADCCRTVPNQARGRSFGAGFRAQDLAANTSVLSGCSPNEQAFEHRDGGHGAFTKCLLEAVTELSANGKVSVARLAEMLKARVPELVKSIAPPDRQTPKLFTTDLVNLQLVSLTTVKPPSPSTTTQPEATTGRSFVGKDAGDRQELVPGIAFRWCPPGSFTMGCPKSELSWGRKHSGIEDQVNVILSSGFWLGETEITQGQWWKLMRTTPWKGLESVKEGVEIAASYISHDDSASFTDKLNERERKAGRLPKGWKYALPTEVQWEYACRAGTKTKFSFGDDESHISDYAWWGGFSDHGNAKNEQYAHKVRQKKSNPWGFHDMHGNVWEWCVDWKAGKLTGGRDPVGPSSGTSRVFRGGCWNLPAVFCRSACRRSDVPDLRNFDTGFRLAAVPE